MVSKKAIIIIAVVVVIAVGGFLAFGAAVSEDNARYNYTLSTADSYKDGYIDHTYHADEGKKFLILDGVIANDKVSEGFYNNPLNVIWAVEMPDHTSLTYASSKATYPEPKLIIVNEGGKAAMAFCWEVDEGLNLDDLKVTCKYEGGKIVNFVYDDKLTL